LLFHVDTIELCSLFDLVGSFFRSLPNVYPGPIHYKRASKSLKSIKLDPKIKNIRNANRKLAAQSLDSLMKSLTIPITQLLNAYKTNIRKLHPYEVNTITCNHLILQFIIYYSKQLTIAELTITARIKAGYPRLEVWFLI
jgi:hypothetical protein